MGGMMFWFMLSPNATLVHDIVTLSSVRVHAGTKVGANAYKIEKLWMSGNKYWNMHVTKRWLLYLNSMVFKNHYFGTVCWWGPCLSTCKIIFNLLSFCLVVALGVRTSRVSIILRERFRGPQENTVWTLFFHKPPRLTILVYCKNRVTKPFNFVTISTLQGCWWMFLTEHGRCTFVMKTFKESRSTTEPIQN